MKLLITGGRDYSNKSRLYAALDSVHNKHTITLLIQGGASGADRLSKEWCVDRGVHCCEVMALWNSYGKAAGHRRNATMLLLNPDGCVAFDGGRGTADMVAKCKRVGVKVMEVSA
jgi:hypothetical protein